MVTSVVIEHPLVEALHRRRHVWTVFVAVGAVVGVVVGSQVFDPDELAITTLLPFLPVTVFAAVLGARLWWLVLHRKGWNLWSGGLCVQGAIVAGVPVAALGISLVGGSPRYFLDAVVPGLFLTMAIARWGCFFAGCCAGHPSASRWAVWSYAKRVAERRVPTQVLESLLCLVIAGVALVLQEPDAGTGLIVLGAIAAYTLGRQGLLDLRLEEREPSFTRPLAITASATVLVATVLVLAGR